MLEEIASTPPDASGVMVATLPDKPIARRCTGVAVTSNSATQTVCTVHVNSVLTPYVDATTTGNGDVDGASGIGIPPGARLVVRWLGASAGAQGRAMVGWESA